MIWLSLWERVTRQLPPYPFHLIMLTSPRNPPKVVFGHSPLIILGPLLRFPSGHYIGVLS
jgi:hypothetical protein